MRVITGATSAAVLTITVGAGLVTYAANRLEGNVNTIDISNQVGERPVDYGDLTSGPLTILVMGSDARTGEGNTKYGYFDGARSDTTMLVHVFPERDSALVLSIPRDTITDLPTCEGPNGSQVPPTRGRFNAAFQRGGPGCTVKATEQLTGLTINHFVVLDFNGFKRTIDALGGVEVCLTRPLQDKKSGIDLPAGRTRVDGEDALAFVRVRHNIGDGSDIGRINRQQLFLSSLIQEVTGTGLLTDPIRLWRVLDESTKSITTDEALADTSAVLAMAGSLSSMRPKDITFVTLPWLTNPENPNTVIVNAAKADPIFEALAKNEPWPPPPTPGSDGKKLTVPPREVLVDVHNATGISGTGSTAATALSAQAFRIGVIDAREKPSRHTIIRHSEEQKQAARTLQAAIPGSILRLDEKGGARLDLTLGEDYQGVEQIKVTPPKGSGATDPSEGSTADQDICTG
jgi:LCP family protein required for cell wall assembly